MAFLDYVLEPPQYGWQDSKGSLVKPSAGQIVKEFFSRLNVFKDRKNWLSFMSWLQVACLAPFFFLFIFKYFKSCVRMYSRYRIMFRNARHL